MNPIVEYLFMMLFGSELRVKITILIYALCIPIAILIATGPIELKIIFWVCIVMLWNHMIKKIKDDLYH